MLGSLPLSSAPLGSGSAVEAGGEPTVYGVLASSLQPVDALLLGDAGVIGQLAAGLPALTGEAVLAGGGKLIGTLSALTGTVVGVQGVIGSATGVLPKTTSTAVGGVYALTAALSPLSSALMGLAGVRGAVGATLPAVTGAAQLNGVGGVARGLLPTITGVLAGVTGGVGTAAAVLPRATGALAGYISVSSVLSASLPRVRTVLAGYGTQVANIRAQLHEVTAAFTTAQNIPGADVNALLTHVTNTLTSAVTTFSNYGFNSFANINGVYLGAGPNGLMKLDSGNLDVTAQITAAFATGQHAFGSTQQKRLSDYYFGGRLAGSMTLTVSTDEQSGYNYRLDPYSVGRLKQRRSHIGKGMRGKYWNFKFTNINGSDFEFDSMGIAAVPTARRI